MSTGQPKWAWWVVGILVPVLIMAVSFFFDRRLDLLQPTLQESAPQGAADEDEIRSLRPTSSSSSRQPRATPQRSAAVEGHTNEQPNVTNDMNHAGIYILTDARPLQLLAGSLTLSATFDTLEGVNYATIIAISEGAEGATSVRHPIYNAGSHFLIRISKRQVRVDILALDWHKRRVTFTLSNSETKE